ncbi:seca inner membrane component of sec protein secretion system [Holotrichia oblita]|nr:seca inner membrane component of sec protein secretion system [Holotrichia oblita]
MNKFAKRLKELREEKGLTQSQLGKATGISQAGIAKWETGDRSPSIDSLIALVKFMKKFKERIKELRIEKEISQKQLSQEIGLSEKTISHYESGYSEPSLDILIKLCVYFETTAGFIIILDFIMKKFLKKLKSFPSALLEAIFPEKITCLICKEELSESVEGVCPVCYKNLPFIEGKTCLKNGQPLNDMSDYCNRCKDEEIFYKKEAAVFEYDDAIKNLIFRFKDDNQKYLNNFLAFCLAQKYAILNFNCNLAVYVPIHKRKLKSRGFNQAEKLCERFGRLVEMPVIKGNLVKVTDTGQQKLLTKAERIKNLEKSFAVNYKNEFKGKDILLIDDIMTTGATANECAKVLNKAGAKRRIAEGVELLADKYAVMSDDELRKVTPLLKKRLSDGETLDDILPDAFAVVREASTRGRIAEMRTGEGKTLVATLPAYLNALTGLGVHVVTVNDYLAKRDTEWMGKIYKFLGLTVGVIVHGMSKEEKQAAYNCDITYCTNNELGFDYLRDNMVTRKNDLVLRPLNYAIVDEVDNILIDEARTPLIISGKGTKSSEIYVTANRFVKSLTREEDYILDEKEKTVRITDDGAKRAERFFNIENLTDIENSEIAHHIQQALKANYVMKRDNDYMVLDGEVIIIDEFTGRRMIGRRYSDGLHQAIEAKEGVRIQGENKTLATITFQNFFRLYKKLSGMTGTAKTEEDEFKGIYNLDVVVIPTNLPMIRKDAHDAIYSAIEGKLRAIVKEVEEKRAIGQPVLIGTLTVEKSEELSKLLRLKKIPHNVLNAKNHQMEAYIIAQAGRFGAVTIATNMAGRGTDIMLGGNPEYLSRQKLKELKYEEEDINEATSYKVDLKPEIKELKNLYEKLYNDYKLKTDEEKGKVIEAGGLHILGTERHESRRIDNQLRGRAGRQGDLGSSVFFISLEDDLAKFFGGDRLQGIAQRLMGEDGRLPLAGFMSRSIENAQKRVEARNFSVRKNVLQYDDVMNKQREIIYKQRNTVLNNEDVHDKVLGMVPDVVSDIIFESIGNVQESGKWDINLLNKNIENKLLEKDSNFVTAKKAEDWDLDLLAEKLTKATIKLYEDKINRYKDSEIDFSEVERIILLKTVDEKWQDHIDAMDQLRKGIGLRAIGQHDPVVSYTKEGFEMFDMMLANIRRDTAQFLLKVEVKQMPKAQAAQATSTNEKNIPVKASKKVGPNDPCPCGSGYKYKRCCEKTVEEYNSVKRVLDDIEVLIDLGEEAGDESLNGEIAAELKKAEKLAENLWIKTLLDGKYDSSNAILTLHAGAGGTESCDWASMLYRMYTRYSEQNDFSVSELDYIDGDGAGIKSVTFQVNGLNAYGYLKAEKGVHRLVRISPFDSNKRRHTSFASLEVMPEINDDEELVIDMEEVRVDTYRSSGAGGQHVNKTDSAVRMTHLPTGIVVQCQNERSQIQNREKCLKMLKSKLIEKKEREMQERLSSIKGNLKKIEWGSQIRSYVFCPYTLVKDHRTGYENSNIQAVMDGDVSGFIIEYLKRM